jgi:hypothetical protein
VRRRLARYASTWLDEAVKQDPGDGVIGAVDSATDGMCGMDVDPSTRPSRGDAAGPKATGGSAPVRLGSRQALVAGTVRGRSEAQRM